MNHNWLAGVEAFAPDTEQERSDKRLILWYAQMFPDTVLLRDNEIAHVTSSGFIVNPSATRMLMAHHNIRGCWAWTGGHADGDSDLLAVALREAHEETGVQAIRPLTPDIAATDILINYGHIRRGRYVSAHLHLNITYLLVADESEALHTNPDENSGVRWIEEAELDTPLFSDHDRALYRRLLERARDARG